MSDRYPVGILGGIGLLLLGIGMVLLATLPASPGVADIVWRMVICWHRVRLLPDPEHEGADVERADPIAAAAAQSGIVATARLTGQTTGAALAIALLALAGHDGATLALALGAGFARSAPS